MTTRMAQCVVGWLLFFLLYTTILLPSCCCCSASSHPFYPTTVATLAAATTTTRRATIAKTRRQRTRTTRTTTTTTTTRVVSAVSSFHPSGCRSSSSSSWSDIIRGGSSSSSSSTWSSRTATPIRTTSQTSASQQQQQQQKYPTVDDVQEDGDDNVDETRKSKTDTKEMIDAFLTRESRNSFIARVYAILSGQLLVTALSVVLFGTWPWLTNLRYSASSRLPMLLSVALSTACWFGVVYSPTARRRAPWKWQLLSLFTLGEAISVGFLTSFYQFHSVVVAMLASALATTSISIYTVQQRNPKYDLSQWGAGLASCGLIFITFGVFQLLEVLGVIPKGLIPFHDGLYSLAGACLFSFYLAYHTKLIVAGKHAKYKMNEQDYVLGAMALYNDVINLFLYMLRIIGEDRDSK